MKIAVRGGACWTAQGWATGQPPHTCQPRKSNLLESIPSDIAISGPHWWIHASPLASPSLPGLLMTRCIDFCFMRAVGIRVRTSIQPSCACRENFQRHPAVALMSICHRSCGKRYLAETRRLWTENGILWKAVTRLLYLFSLGNGPPSFKHNAKFKILII